MIRGIAAGASRPGVADAAEAVLAAGGSAVDAVIAGFFAAAGADAGVLLAPAVALVAGAGVGARAFDGRAAQPGRGATRPRGFVDDASIPAAARVAAPRSVAMLVLLHGYRGRTALGELARPGVIAAEREGAKARAALLRRVGAAGVLALRAPEVERALLAAGGPVAGGILTAEDIEEATPAETEATSTAAGEAMVATAPFPPPEDFVGGTEAILACDGRGVLAALCYLPARAGAEIDIPDLELAAGLHAVPVRRGVPRVGPGTPLAMPAPAAILTRKGFSAAVALPDVARIDPARLEELASGAAAETALGALRDHAGGGRALAIVSDGRTGRSMTV